MNSCGCISDLLMPGSARRRLQRLTLSQCLQAPSKAEGKALLANPALLEQELASATKAASSTRPAPPPPPPPPLPEGKTNEAAQPRTVRKLYAAMRYSPAGQHLTS